MNIADWLDSLKPGDEVYISRNYYGQVPEQAKVVRRTKTMIMVGKENCIGKMYETRFYVSDGWSVGAGRWDRQYLIEPTDEVRERVEVSELVRRVVGLKNHISVPNDKETLLKMIEALTPFVKKEG